MILFWHHPRFFVFDDLDPIYFASAVHSLNHKDQFWSNKSSRPQAFPFSNCACFSLPFLSLWRVFASLGVYSMYRPCLCSVFPPFVCFVFSCTVLRRLLVQFVWAGAICPNLSCHSKGKNWLKPRFTRSLA